MCAHIILARCVESVQYPVSKHKFQTRSLYTTRTRTHTHEKEERKLITQYKSSTVRPIPLCPGLENPSASPPDTAAPPWPPGGWESPSLTHSQLYLYWNFLTYIMYCISYIQPIMVYTHPQYDCVENTMILIGHTLPP